MLVFTIFCAIGIAFYAIHKMSHKLKDLENSSKNSNSSKQTDFFQNKNNEFPKKEYKTPEVILPEKNQFQNSNKEKDSKDYVEQGLTWILNKVNKK
jgi:hypothetical protein